MDFRGVFGKQKRSNFVIMKSINVIFLSPRAPGNRKMRVPQGFKKELKYNAFFDPLRQEFASKYATHMHISIYATIAKNIIQYAKSHDQKGVGGCSGSI